jgi:hypothetical protein
LGRTRRTPSGRRNASTASGARLRRFTSLEGGASGIRRGEGERRGDALATP